MAAPPTRDQVLSLLAAANNHGDLSVKTTSLKQAKDLLLSLDPSLSADLFPYLLELQSSPESLVRKLLIQIIEEIGFRAVENSPTLISVLLTFLRDSDVTVTKQSIVSGTNIFCSCVEEMIVQFQQSGKVERWLEEIWMGMLKFKDAVFGIVLEGGSVGEKLLALKFLEIFVLFFTSDINDPEKSTTEGVRQAVNISWLVGCHPVLDPMVLMTEANRTVGVLLNLLQSAGNLPGCLTITVVNCMLTSLYEQLMTMGASSLVVHIMEVTVIRPFKMVPYLYYGVPVGWVIEIESDALKWPSCELRKHGRQVMQFIIVNC